MAFVASELLSFIIELEAVVDINSKELLFEYFKFVDSSELAFFVAIFYLHLIIFFFLS